jgi:hypothetical protein
VLIYYTTIALYDGADYKVTEIKEVNNDFTLHYLTDSNLEMWLDSGYISKFSGVMLDNAHERKWEVIMNTERIDMGRVAPEVMNFLKKNKRKVKLNDIFKT